MRILTNRTRAMRKFRTKIKPSKYKASHPFIYPHRTAPFAPPQNTSTTKKSMSCLLFIEHIEPVFISKNRMNWTEGANTDVEQKTVLLCFASKEHSQVDAFKQITNVWRVQLTGLIDSCDRKAAAKQPNGTFANFFFLMLRSSLLFFAESSGSLMYDGRHVADGWCVASVLGSAVCIVVYVIHITSTTWNIEARLPSACSFDNVESATCPQERSDVNAPYTARPSTISLLTWNVFEPDTFKYEKDAALRFVYSNWWH